MSAEAVEILKTIIPAVISAVVALVVATKQNKIAAEDINQKHNEQLTLILYRLEQLEKKMDKHNNFMERLGIVETKINLFHGKGESDGKK